MQLGSALQSEALAAYNVLIFGQASSLGPQVNEVLEETSWRTDMSIVRVVLDSRLGRHKGGSERWQKEEGGAVRSEHGLRKRRAGRA